MPTIGNSFVTSPKRTGKEYMEVHQWLDDPARKNERHDTTKIPDTVQMFKDQYGEEAAREYVQHLSDDINGRFGHALEDLSKDMASVISSFGSQ